ncbi:hypothetical protein KKC1_00200 [Calderihabitans maritimus]|uniref:YjcZ family sporulation protein n=1 Tax=Calderihabitans maritimus TaxID=1246530 RepID=A0A1Z5HN15_9FIRM|nr:hypothetical protein KKC1_00200 [Calderihabitans maritimus]
MGGIGFSTQFAFALFLILILLIFADE